MDLAADSTLAVAGEPASGLRLGMVRGASICSNLPFERDGLCPYRHRHVKGAVVIAADSRGSRQVEAHQGRAN
jgi:hypothetical protein